MAWGQGLYWSVNCLHLQCSLASNTALNLTEYFPVMDFSVILSSCFARKRRIRLKVWKIWSFRSWREKLIRVKKRKKRARAKSCCKRSPSISASHSHARYGRWSISSLADKVRGYVVSSAGRASSAYCIQCSARNIYRISTDVRNFLQKFSFGMFLFWWFSWSKPWVLFLVHANSNEPFPWRYLKLRRSWCSWCRRGSRRWRNSPHRSLCRLSKRGRISRERKTICSSCFRGQELSFTCWCRKHPIWSA